MSASLFHDPGHPDAGFRGGGLEQRGSLLPRWFRIRVLYPCGAALHLGTVLFMGVSSFSIVMFAALTLLVLPVDTDLRAIRELLPRRHTAPSPGGSPAENEEERTVVLVP